MMKLIEEGKIRRVFVWKQDRIVSGVKLWGHITWPFERAGTQLIDILTGKDLAADDIATVVNARGAKEEQIKISNDALRAKVSLAKAGMPISKIPPFGDDKKYLDASGGHRWTAHVLTASRRRGGTRYLTVMADGNRYEMDVLYRKNKSDRVVYVPTEIAPDRIQAVQYAFRTFAAESITVAKLAVRMNRLGFTIYGKPWLKTTLEGILRNPAYVGDVRLNNVSRGEFTVYLKTSLIGSSDTGNHLIHQNPALAHPLVSVVDELHRNLSPTDGRPNRKGWIGLLAAVIADLHGRLRDCCPLPIRHGDPHAGTPCLR